MKNNSGFTIMELVVGMWISAVAVLALITLISWAAAEYENVKARLRGQSDALRLEVLMRKYFTTAMNVKGWDLSNGSLDSTNPEVTNGPVTEIRWDGQGRITQTENYDRLSLYPADGWLNVAVFLREWREPVLNTGSSTRRSDLRPTAVFFKAPTNVTAGVMFFDVNDDTVKEPGYDDHFVAGITEFEINKEVDFNIRHRDPIAGDIFRDQKVLSLLIRYKIRYHTLGNGQVKWCPVWDIDNSTAGCGNNMPFSEIERSVRIVLVNNDVGTRNNFGVGLEWMEERPIGALHFFRPIIPNVWGNL